MEDNASRPPFRFPLDAWRITETEYQRDQQFLAETLFALGNGYIGLRATQEDDAADVGLEGTYLNGFYDTEPIRYPENAYGLARNNQFMLNVPNAKAISLLVQGECFALGQGVLLSYERALDLRAGVLRRNLVWQSPQGRQIRVTSTRLVSFARKHVFAMEYQVQALNFSGQIQIISHLQGDVSNMQAGDDPRVGSAIEGVPLQWQQTAQTATASSMLHRTRHSGFALCSGVDHQCSAEAVLRQNEHAASHTFSFEVTAGATVSLTKYAAYFSSRDYPETELAERSQQALHEAMAAGFAHLCAEQQRYLDAYWHQAEIEIAGDQATAQGLRFNQFHLLQSVGRDGKTNIAAKGVTGEGYEGHYFWDTEIYIFPYFLCNQPDIAKKLLEFRFSGLQQARARARQMGHAKGALYPWRTIAGEECSAYFPAGTAQYHINADIAHAVKLYWRVCQDDAFMLEQGAEMVLETVRIWLDLGYYDADAGHFYINEVTGPDEYTALVNNNYYTNLMAQQHLRFALDIAAHLSAQHPDRYRVLCQQIDLQEQELIDWKNAAEHMYLPHDDVLGLDLQDDSFLRKKKWDFANTPAENYPLLLHYHPMVIYRHQVCKQADVVLALLLHSQHFSLQQKRNDFNYYEAITTHDSSLSSCIFSIIAAELGYAGKAYNYFMETARLDLDNTHGNTEYGVHTAAMAGTWMGVTMGFAGLRLDGELPRFQPSLPAQWQHYQFKLRLGASLLQLRIAATGVTYSLLEGPALRFRHGDIVIALTPQHATQTQALITANSTDGEQHV